MLSTKYTAEYKRARNEIHVYMKKIFLKYQFESITSKSNHNGEISDDSYGKHTVSGAILDGIY